MISGGSNILPPRGKAQSTCSLTDAVLLEIGNQPKVTKSADKESGGTLERISISSVGRPLDACTSHLERERNQGDWAIRDFWGTCGGSENLLEHE